MSLSLEQKLRTEIENLPTLYQMEKNLAERSLYWFSKLAWRTISPDPWLDNWHLKLICQYLESLLNGDIRFLNVNIPPRMAKSTLVNVMLYCYATVKRPSIKFIYVTSNENLAERDSGYCRDIIKSDWFKSMWPHILIKKDYDQKLAFGNVYGGYRLAFGVNSGFTGQGADIICCDDLNDPREVLSDKIREGINQTFAEKISNRFINPKTGRIINIQQRLHEDDVSGFIMSGKNKDKWESLILPMVYDGQRYVSSIGLNDPRKKGELLWPDRFGPEQLEREQNQGEIYFSQQYQQRISPLSGQIFNPKWFKTRFVPDNIVYRYLSFDTAGTTGENSAYSCCCVFDITANYQAFLRNVIREKLEFPQLKDWILSLANYYRDKLSLIFIENKSTGTPALQTLRQAADPFIQSILIDVNIKPDEGKEVRAKQSSVWCEQGAIILPPPTDEFSWLAQFEQELFNFPSSKFKDQVDSFTMGINQLSDYFVKRQDYLNSIKRGG
jgi:predicted phage terminase large subunit-like protein